MTTPSWECPIEGIREETGLGDYAFTCPSLEVDLPLIADATDLTISAKFVVSSSEKIPDLDKVLNQIYTSSASDSERAQEWAAIRQSAVSALSADDETYQIKTEPFSVWFPPPPEKRGNFAVMFIVLLLIGAASRLFTAWRLRPWPALPSADYMSVSVRRQAGELVAIEIPERSETCMALSSSNSSALVGGVELSSPWKPLLLGKPRRITAESPGADCLGPEGAESGIGVVGASLKDGWILTSTPTGDSLIVLGVQPASAVLVKNQVSRACDQASAVSAGHELPDAAQPAADHAAESAQGDEQAADQERRETISGYQSDPFAAGPEVFGGGSWETSRPPKDSPFT